MDKKYQVLTIGLLAILAIFGFLYFKSKSGTTQVKDTYNTSDTSTTSAPKTNSFTIVPPKEQTVSTGPVTVIKTADVARHNKFSDCWIIISGKVYNVSGYTGYPGGAGAITPYCGKKVTTSYATNGVDTYLANYYIGEVDTGK